MDCKLTISMSKFLLDYYNIKGEVVNKLTHEQINEMLNLGQILDDNLSIEDVLTGKVLLVKDSEGKLQGYKNPLINKKDYVDEEPSSVIISFEEEPIINIDNIHDCTNYELEELIKDCKKTKNDKAKNAIIKDLNKRDGNNKQTKVKIRKRNIRKE
jgi:hypothetical protein